MDLRPVEFDLPPRGETHGYKRPKRSSIRWISEPY
jgi:hypothetical protein